MTGYTPLFQSLATGTLYGKWPDIGLWPIVLSQADRRGILDVTPEYLASITGLSLPEVVACMARFCEPDPRSRSREEHGRRLVLIDPARDWGWRVVNHRKFRERARLMAKDSERTVSGADAARKRTQRTASPPVPRRPPLSPSQTRQDKTRQDTDANPQSARARDARSTPDPEPDPAFDGVAFYREHLAEPYPRHDLTDTDKMLAGRAIEILVSEGLATPERLLQSVQEYRQQQNAAGNTDTTYVKKPANFFGTAGHWRGPFPIAAEKAKPRTAADLVSFRPDRSPSESPSESHSDTPSDRTAAP